MRRPAALALSLTLSLVAIEPVLHNVRAQEAPCSWPLLLDDASLNVAFPDTGSTYWMTRFVSVPQTRLVIRGTYPHARYFSFHAYDEAQRPVDSLADFEIDPDKGSFNPYRRGARAGERAYTVHVEFGPEPERRQRNTLYAGTMNDGTPNPMGFLIYRVYVSDDARDPAGKVLLPDVSLEGPNGASLEFTQCEPLPPQDDSINEAMRESSFPDEIPREAPFPGTLEDPFFRRFYGPDREIRERFPSNPVTGALPYVNGGFLQSEHVAYLYARISRDWGDVFVFRAKAPTFPDTRKGDAVTARRDMRYWSICQNELATQRVTQCSPDYETVLERDGYFTFVISDPADRPKNATKRHGINWLPWGGGYYDGVVIYRHMLPARSFGAAIQNIEEGEDPGKLMGAYYPSAAYCTADKFERTSWRGCL